jgi:protein tyrosine/serine phosphatase
VKRLYLPLVILIILSFGMSETRQVLRNFHVVEQNKLYRSAQLSPDALSATIALHNIKTVINLQGEHPDDDWYIQERATLKHLHVTLIDIPMRTERIPTRDEITSLFDVYDHGQRPMLIHCNSGSDRTGEASAIYQMEYMHKTKEQALEMMSPKYFHLSFLVPSKTYFLDLYKGKDWALNEYDPCRQKYSYFDQNRECRHSASHF